MQTPFIAIQIQSKERKEKIQTKVQGGRIFSSQRSDRPNFLSTSCPSPTRSCISYQNSRKITSRSPKQNHDQQRAQSSTTRTKNIFQDKTEQSQKKTSFQIMMRQTLRRTKNKSKNSFQPNTLNWINTYKKFVGQDQLSVNANVNTNGNERQMVDSFNFSQIQGKKCILENYNNKARNLRNSHSNQNKKIRKTRSLQVKNKQVKQLKIINDDGQKINLDELNQPIQAIGMASKKQAEKFQLKIPQNVVNCSKIAISTINNVFIGNEIHLQNQNRTYLTGNPSPQAQNNFIRAKKKSNLLHKKVANLQKQQQEQDNKLNQSKIFSFKNSFGKNAGGKGCMPLSLSLSDAVQFQILSKNGRKNNGNKKEDNMRIEGWEIMNGFENQAIFVNNQIVHFK